MRAWELRVKHSMTVRQVAEELGVSYGTAYNDLKAASKEHMREPAEQVVKYHLERLDRYRQTHMGILGAFAQRFEKAVREGAPLPDPKPLNDSLAQLAKLDEREAKLLGLDAPTRVDATVHEVTQEDLEIIDLINKEKAEVHEQMTNLGRDNARAE